MGQKYNIMMYEVGKEPYLVKVSGHNNIYRPAKFNHQYGVEACRLINIMRTDSAFISCDLIEEKGDA